MKRIFLAGAVIASSMIAANANAQSLLSNLLSGVASAASTSNTTSSTKSSASTTATNALGTVLNNVVGTATSNVSESNSELVSYLISSVTGNLTTTAATVVGTWNYIQPSVQFESENYLTQAGGAAIAEKLQSKLASFYKLVGIKQGKMTFTFDNSGNVTYGVGSISRSGTYVFDSDSKTITITTATGANIKCYVTVSGTTMNLTFDGSKFLTFMKTLGSKFSMLSTVAELANSYQGMKVGFEFEKQK